MTAFPDYKGLIYRDDAGEYRWRLLARNGNIVADSGEGYVDKGDCADMFARLHPDIHVEWEDVAPPP